MKLTRKMLFVMALACGVAVANIYYNQPLIGLLEHDFPGRLIRFVPTATQLGYALGLLLLVPLGDRFDRRSLISVQMLALSAALAGTALSSSAWTLVATSVLVGVTASVAQQIVPLAAELSEPGKRGRTIGFVMSGLLCGILLGRTVAGFVGKQFGWRTMFEVAVGLALVMSTLVYAVLPSCKAKSKATYRSLLISLGTLVWEERALLRAAGIQAALFASFSVFWSILALQLEDRFRLGSDIAGLFGLLGTVGILIAPLAGRAADRRGPHLVVGLCSVVMLLSWLVFGLWTTMAGLVAGVILLDFGQQGALVSNQHIIYSLRPEARNRMNTVFMVVMFLGGAAGSAAASFARQMGNWSYVSILGAALSLIPLAIQAVSKPASLTKTASSDHTISDHQ